MSIDLADDLSRLFMVSDIEGQESRADTAADMPALMLDATTKAMDGEIRTDVVASTSDVDRAGDIVEQDWRLKNYRRNPVVLWMHNRMQPPVGRAVDVRTTERGKSGQLTMGIVWDTDESNPIGMTVGNQYARGYLHAVSVGFLPGSRVRRTELPEDDPRRQSLKPGQGAWEAGLVLSRNELLENSAVTVPANPAALAVRAWAMEAEDPAEQESRALSETVSRADADWLLTVLRSDERIRDQIRSILLSMPEPQINEPSDEITEWLRALPKASDSLDHLFLAPSATNPK